MKILEHENTIFEIKNLIDGFNIRQNMDKESFKTGRQGRRMHTDLITEVTPEWNTQKLARQIERTH